MGHQFAERTRDLALFSPAIATIDSGPSLSGEELPFAEEIQYSEAGDQDLR